MKYINKVFCSTWLVVLIIIPTSSSETPNLDAYSELKYTGDNYIHVGMILANLSLSEDRKFEDTKLGKKFKLFCKSFLYGSRGSSIHLVFLTDTATIPHIKRTLINQMGKTIFAGRMGMGSEIHSFQDIIDPEWVFPSFANIFETDGRARKLLGTEDCRHSRNTMMKYYGFTEPSRIETLPDGRQVRLLFDKYQKDLFYIAPFYPEVFPESLQYILMLDVDLDLRIDLSELAEQRKLMADSEVIGVGAELTPHYHMLTKPHRIKYPDSDITTPGTKQGYNTGVVIYDLAKMRASESFKSQINEESYARLKEEYAFMGSVGDQDLFTQMGFRKPELFYNLPCGFNFQTYLNQLSKGEALELYSAYHNCKDDPKIIHNNSDASD